MRLNMRRFGYASLLAGVAAVASPAANAVTFTTTGAATVFSLGAAGSYQNTSLYDQLTLDPVVGGTFGVGQITLNLVEFNVGINADVANPVNPGTIYESMTVSDGGGTNSHFPISFNLAISYSDILTIHGTTLSFNGWQVVIPQLVMGPNFGGLETAPLFAEVSQVSAATAPTPLPAALPLFATGLGVIGLLAKRRKRKASAAV